MSFPLEWALPERKKRFFFLAAMNGNIAVLQNLLLSGEHHFVVDHCEQTPLHLAARSAHVAMVDFLTTQGQFSSEPERQLR